MRVGSHKWLVERKKETLRQEAALSYRDKLKVYLTFTLEELKEMKHPLYDIVKKTFPNLPETATLDDARFVKFFDKLFRESSTKVMEMSFKLDGSMSDLTNDPDYAEVEEAMKGVK